MRCQYFIPVALVFLAGSLTAQEPARRQFSFEARTGHDRLSGGRTPWNNQSVMARFRYTLKTGFGIGAERVERFALNDSRLVGDASTALGSRVTAGINGDVSSTHHVIPRHTVGGYFYLSLPSGWGVETGGQQKSYDSVSVSALHASLDRYFGNYLMTYRVSPVRLAGESAVSHMLRLTRFIGEQGSIAFVATAGREVDAFTASGPLIAQAKGGAIFGALPVSERAAIVFAGEVSDHRNLFTRRHVSLGLRLTSKASGTR